MKSIVISFLLFLCYLSSFSQEINPDPFDNRIVLKHYSKAELTQIKNQHFEKYKRIKFWYIHSFIIDSTALSNCPDFNPSLFDVSEYENYRMTDRRVTITLPDCDIRVTLLSSKELDYLVLHNGIIPSEINPDK